MPRGNLIQVRRGTTAQWAAADAASASDPDRLLAAGEPGRDTTTGELKIGDGVTKFADLPGFLDENELGTRFAPKIVPGSPLVRTMPDAAVMDSPPTLTATASAPAGLTVTKNAFSGFGTYWPGFRVSGAPLFAIGAGTSFPRNARKLDDAQSAWGGTARIEFDHEGPKVGFRLQAVPSAFVRLWVNERPATSAFVSLQSVSGVSGTGTHHFTWDFGSTAYRRLVIEWAALPSGPTNFSGVVHAPTDGFFPPSIPSARLMVLGDSYGYGVGALGNNDAYPIHMARYLGIADVWNFAASPSTGVLKTDTSSNTGPYSTRLDADVIPHMRPGDVLIYQGSLNDAASTAADVQAQALADLTKLRTALPGTHIIVTSPLFVATAPQSYFDLRTALSNAAAAAGLPFVDVLTTSLGLFKGTGTAAAPAGDGNADLYRNADGVHPNSPGHKALARVLARMISPLIGQAR